MRLLIGICKLVYAPCFSPVLGRSALRDFCIAVRWLDFIESGKVVRAKVHLVTGLYMCLVKLFGGLLSNGTPSHASQSVNIAGETGTLCVIGACVILI